MKAKLILKLLCFPSRADAVYFIVLIAFFLLEKPQNTIHELQLTPGRRIDVPR